nr:MAG: DNA-binding response regulator [Pseudomonadota bacterium]
MPKALIVDDEPPARARLSALLRELGQVEVVGEAGDAAATLELVGKLNPDILYLDVRMPGMSGLELARHLARLPDPPAIVFITAHDEHALEAFEADAVGYLLKPVRREKLAAATERARRLTARQLEDVARPEPRTHLSVRHRDGIRLLRVEDIICLLAEQKYTTVRHTGGEDLVEDSLRQLEAEFGGRFLRVHRGALVNRDYLAGVERLADGGYVAHVRGLSEPLPVSRRMAAELKARL